MMTNDELAVVDTMTGDIWLYTLPRLGMSNDEIDDFIFQMGFDIGIQYTVNRQITIHDER